MTDDGEHITEKDAPTPDPSTCPTPCVAYNHPGREHEQWLGGIWDEGVDAAFKGAITRQNAEDVKRRNPYLARVLPPGDGHDEQT